MAGAATEELWAMPVPTIGNETLIRSGSIVPDVAAMPDGGYLVSFSSQSSFQFGHTFGFHLFTGSGATVWDNPNTLATALATWEDHPRIAGLASSDFALAI